MRLNRLTVMIATIGLVLMAHSTAAPAGEQATAGPTATPGTTFIALAYHEVLNDVRDYPDPYAVDSAALVMQFAWLHGNGYTPVSIDQIVTAREGGKPLPAKAVLLTFDDAYMSFYIRVYPLLREFGFPAVLAVVGSWIDGTSGGPGQYGEKGAVPQASFSTWDQLREMAASGLVEIGSHTYDLHRGVPGNPQGNLQPAATTRVHHVESGGYEDDAGWRARVREDLARNADVIEKKTGRRPRVIAWPFGSYNDELVRMAAELGSSIALTLGDGTNTAEVPLSEVRRIVVGHNPALGDFVAEVRGARYDEPIRAVRIALDDVYSPEPAQQERNLSLLLDRIQVFKPTHVYLQAYADIDGDGVADAAYFPNRSVALRADLFNRVAWQLSTRTGVRVFAVLPAAGFHLPAEGIVELYIDLVRHATFAGLLFDDEAGVNKSEDAIAADFIQRVAGRVRAFRAPIKIARSLSVPTTVSAAEIRFLQPLPALLNAYDQIVLTEIPARDGAADNRLTVLAEQVARGPIAPDDRRKIVFMLHSDNRRGDRNSAGDRLARQMLGLQLGGALNFGYYPDDFRHDNPPLAKIGPAMSRRVHPVEMRDPVQTSDRHAK